MIRRIFRWVFLGVLGVLVGLVLYEAATFVRVYWLRTHNPSSTSLIDTRASEARAKGLQPRREQVWVPLERISANLQRAVLAGAPARARTGDRGRDRPAGAAGVLGRRANRDRVLRARERLRGSPPAPASCDRAADDRRRGCIRTAAEVRTRDRRTGTVFTGCRRVVRAA